MLLYIGAVVEAKAQLVGIHERVRSDVEGNITQSPSSQANGSNATQGVKRVATATNPNAEDAAELLRYISFLCNVARSIHFFILYPPPPPTQLHVVVPKFRPMLLDVHMCVCTSVWS